MTKPRALALLLAASVSAAARAETAELRCARPQGLAYLALLVMEHEQLVEKYAKAQGLGDLKVTWVPGAAEDALLSGGLDFAAGEVPALVALWARTKGTPQEVRGVGALEVMPLQLLTSSPRVKTIRDFKKGDKIAVPEAKTSTQAVLLAMAAAKAFGDGKHARLDPLTVAMSHAEAAEALLSGGVTAHFSSPPSQKREAAKQGVRVVTSSYDILGGDATVGVVFTTARFKEENPKAYAAFFAALEEATHTIRKNKKAAAAVYQRLTQSSEPAEELAKQLSDPKVTFTLTPHRTLPVAEFMHRIGLVPARPAAWKDLYFENLHGRDGS